MASKLLLRTILGTSLAFFMGTQSVSAQSIDGTSATQTSCTAKQIKAGLCSISVEGILKKLGNVIRTPDAFAATMLIRKGEVIFRNPAVKSGTAEGVPFVTESVAFGAVPIDANRVSHNGKSLASVVFHDAELVQAVIDGLTVLCNGTPTVPPDPNACDTLAAIQREVDLHPNWAQTVVVTLGEFLGQNFIDPDTSDPACDLVTEPIDTTNCTQTDAEGTICSAPPEVLADPVSFAWVGFTYRDAVLDASGNPLLDASGNPIPSANECGTTPVCHDSAGTSCSPYTLPL